MFNLFLACRKDCSFACVFSCFRFSHVVVCTRRASQTIEDSIRLGPALCDSPAGSFQLALFSMRVGDWLALGSPFGTVQHKPAKQLYSFRVATGRSNSSSCPSNTALLTGQALQQLALGWATNVIIYCYDRQHGKLHSCPTLSRP
jgi:hypothetical protein